MISFLISSILDTCLYIDLNMMTYQCILMIINTLNHICYKTKKIYLKTAPFLLENLYRLNCLFLLPIVHMYHNT